MSDIATISSITAAAVAIKNSNNSSTSLSLGGGDEAVALPPTAALSVVNPAICRYFQRGICRFGTLCRFSHELSGSEVNSNSNIDGGSFLATATTSAHSTAQPKPSTSRHNWANADAPIFVPTYKRTEFASGSEDVEPLALYDPALPVDNSAGDQAAANSTPQSWAYVVSGRRMDDAEANNMQSCVPGSVDIVCPFESPCPYGAYCMYSIHLELCKMCDQYCLHPNDQAQRRNHNQECLQQHEQAMELSFAIARSKDKTCGICFDTIMEKSGREKRFGILPNCSHIFCLECIRKWRQAKQFEHKITRSCPECRVSSDFVCPSAFWVETKEEKDKLLNDYRTALGIKDCKYFKKGEGKCPFGNKCFYKHALPNGDVVDVGCPKRARKLHRSTSEIIDLLDIYLWEYVDQRDYHWLDLLSSTSDDSDDTDWSDD